jgi:Tfp pilus assembly protein PilN
MKPVMIDFAPPSLRRTVTQSASRWWGMALGGALLCGSAALLEARQHQQQHSHQARQRQLEALRVNAPPPARAVIAEAQATAVNGAVQQLNLPWRDLHEAIEAATPKDVALLALEPDPRSRSLRISAEAKNSDTMLAYVAQLRERPFFAGALLIKHDTSEQDPNQALRFQVDVQWNARRMP